jgi:hypothetical protein
MTLSCKLDDALLTMTCRQCGHPCTRKGSWFKHVRTFKCAACGYATQITYDDKLRLFDKHAKLTTAAPERKAALRFSSGW